MLHMEPTIAQILLDNLAACKSLDSYDIAFRKAISTFEDDRIRHITEAINQRKLSFLVGELNHKLFSPDLFQWLAIGTGADLKFQSPRNAYPSLRRSRQGAGME